MNEYLKKMIEEYNRICNAVGIQMECLDKDSDKFGKTEVVAEQKDEEMTVRIYGPISSWFGFSVQKLINKLDEAGDKLKKIKLILQSPGGSVQDGVALYSDLRTRATENNVKVITQVRGLAASIASVIMLAGEERIMGEASQVMIHRPMGGLFMFGDIDDAKKAYNRFIAHMEAADKNIVGIYTSRTGNSKSDIEDWMKNETFFDVEDSIKKEFATGKVEGDDEGAEDDDVSNELLQNIVDARRMQVMNEIKRSIV